MTSLLVAPAEIAAPSDREFRLFQTLIREEAGIWLTPAKKDLLVARLRKRLRELGLGSFQAYYGRVTADAAERLQLLDRISTNETRFFRESEQLGFLVERVLPRLRHEALLGRRPLRVRAWSAGCSTGEEPFSLGMILRQALPVSEGWQLEILATDISTRALRIAAEGCYDVARAVEIPEQYRTPFLLRGVRSRVGLMQVGPGIRSLVRFERLNLCRDLYPPGPFDLVLCRNVLIYFAADTRERVITRLAEPLARDGLLLLGHAESLSGGHGLRHAGPLSYARAAEHGR